MISALIAALTSGASLRSCQSSRASTSDGKSSRSITVVDRNAKPARNLSTESLPQFACPSSGTRTPHGRGRLVLGDLDAVDADAPGDVAVELPGRRRHVLVLDGAEGLRSRYAVRRRAWDVLDRDRLVVRPVVRCASTGWSFAKAGTPAALGARQRIVGFGVPMLAGIDGTFRKTVVERRCDP